MTTTTETTTEPTMKLLVTTEIPLKRVADLLCTAFEGGGVGYWCRIVKQVKPRGGGPETWALRAFADDKGTKGTVYPHIEYVPNGGMLYLAEDDDDLRALEDSYDAYRRDADEHRQGAEPDPVQDIVEWLEEGSVTVWKLDLDACKRGLQVMAEEYPRHFADFMSENEDAETADVWLQCCLFGEVVYG